MRALVIGAAGFVGNYLVRHLLEQGDEVFAGTLKEPVALLSDTTLSVDITDSASVAELMHRARPDVVYHLAGISFVPEAESDFDKTLRVNVAGTANVLRQAHLFSKSTSVLFVSSAEVYGHISPTDLPIRETTPTRPANNYSLSKRMAELVAERYVSQGALRCTVVRPFNHIGPGQDSRFVASNFAMQLARIAHGKAPPTLKVGNLEARRDFSDVRDIVRAYRFLAQQGSGVFNLGSGVPRSIQFLLDTLIKVSGLAVKVEQDPARMRGPEVPELYASYEKAHAAAGWKPVITIEQSLADIYGYWHERVRAEVAA
jgi:GDP-4-dehydro-6-deoxy-D-mannose reductase